ncbi:MAG: TraB/GumN family protein [Nitrospira sp.]|nr:TraB/GumN family protein [Nitrospira sp.]
MKSAHLWMALLLSFLWLHGEPSCDASAIAGEANPDAQAILQQIEAAPKRGILFEVAGSKGKAYLFGTIHVGKPEYYPLDKMTTSAMASSKVLAVEADVLNQQHAAQVVFERAMYQPPESLDQVVKPEVLSQVTPLLDRFQLPQQQAWLMKPWMLAMTLTLLDGQQAGYDPGYGVDLFLLGMAQGMKKPVVELESLESQFALFDGFSLEEQQMFLEEAVKGIESGESKAQLSALADAWASADRTKLTAALKMELEQQTPLLRKLYEKLLTQRNLAMADKVERLLQSGDQSFVAVGTFHLLGEDSVVALLAKRGYKIKAL